MEGRLRYLLLESRNGISLEFDVCSLDPGLFQLDPEWVFDSPDGETWWRPLLWCACGLLAL